MTPAIPFSEPQSYRNAVFATGTALGALIGAVAAAWDADASRGLLGFVAGAVFGNAFTTFMWAARSRLPLAVVIAAFGIPCVATMARSLSNSGFVPLVIPLVIGVPLALSVSLIYRWREKRREQRQLEIFRELCLEVGVPGPALETMMRSRDAAKAFLDGPDPGTRFVALILVEFGWSERPGILSWIERVAEEDPDPLMREGAERVMAIVRWEDQGRG
jgi:hypothetical protein